MADRIVVLNGGHVEQVGAPIELYDTPNNVFVAGFIGSPAMNLLEGEIAGGRFVDQTGAAWPVDRPDLEGRKVTYGIRPEDLGPSGEGVEAIVKIIEPTGSETHVTVSIGDQELLVLIRDRIALRPSDAILLAPDIGKIHIFDAATGQRL